MNYPFTLFTLSPDRNTFYVDALEHEVRSSSQLPVSCYQLDAPLEDLWKEHLMGWDCWDGFSL